jgi:hypothetical protein
MLLKMILSLKTMLLLLLMTILLMCDDNVVDENCVADDNAVVGVQSTPNLLSQITFSQDNQPVHVLNMDIVDNAEDATIGAFLLCELATALANSQDLDDEIVDIIQVNGLCVVSVVVAAVVVDATTADLVAATVVVVVAAAALVVYWIWQFARKVM